MSKCEQCGIRIGEGSTASYCPSCEQSYSLVAVPIPGRPEWHWRLYCRIYRLWPRLGARLEHLFATRDPQAISAVLEGRE